MLEEFIMAMEENSKTPVDGSMLIAEILRLYPEAAYVLMNCGMGCIGCPPSQMESLSEACFVHGLDADEVIKYLNYELGLTAAE
jgi:hybrid cluster-associated redox disulfide protein